MLHNTYNYVSDPYLRQSMINKDIQCEIDNAKNEVEYQMQMQAAQSTSEPYEGKHFKDECERQAYMRSRAGMDKALVIFIYSMSAFFVISTIAIIFAAIFS